MTYNLLQIPGQTTRFDDHPRLVVMGGGNESLSVVISYYASEESPDHMILLGEIVFLDVLEFRWVENDVAYEAYPQHENDYDFGLIEIENSAYVETMASRGSERAYVGTRIRSRPESEIRHFRMGFDEWGTLDVIATEICISSKVVPRLG